ncbi:MAG: peptidase M23, partial [Kurthia sp.]
MKSTKHKSTKFLVATAALFLFIQTPSVYATNLSDLKEEKNQVETKKNELNSSIKVKTGAISTIEAKQQNLVNQIETLNAEINKTNSSIQAVLAEIDVANAEIEALKASIEELMRKIEERDALLQERARAIQAGGSVSYLDVLLGSNSFVDFIDRFSAVNTLLEADRQIMRDQKADQQKLEEQKQVLEDKRQKLEGKKAELQNLKASLDG